MAQLQFTRTHEWLRREGDEVVVGITEHAQQLLGDMVFVDFPDEGTEVRMGDELGVVESVKAASDFYAPIAGVVTAVNNAVSDTPALVNTDPYGEGWLVRMKMMNPQELNNLLTEAAYQETIVQDN